MSTAKVLLWANGMELTRVDGGGIESWFGDWVSHGSQVSSKISAVTRSEIGLAIVLHSTGLSAPPKVNLSEMRT